MTPLRWPEPVDPTVAMIGEGRNLAKLLDFRPTLRHGVTLCPHNVYGQASSCQWERYGHTQRTLQALREHMALEHRRP